MLHPARVCNMMIVLVYDARLEKSVKICGISVWVMSSPFPRHQDVVQKVFEQVLSVEECAIDRC